jgi:glycosyltransferase involved in cell wall biosynthesis
MNIAFAIHESLAAQGGVEVLAREMIRYFSKSHQVYLISIDSGETLKNLTEGRMLAGNFTIPNDRLISMDWIGSLVSWLKKHEINLCHFHSGGTYGFNARSWSCCPITCVSQAGIRCIVTNHQAVCFFNRLRSKRPLWRELLAAIANWPGKAKQLSAVDAEITVSNHDLALSKNYFPFHQKKMRRIYHSRLEASEKMTPVSKSRTILNVATLARIKGQYILLEAFNFVSDEFPEWRLKLVGYDSNDGSSEKLRKRITMLDLSKKVDLCGPHTDPRQFYRTAELYVQPSLAEAFGLSLQEAMFHGLPCIGSRVGGIPELISEGQTGYLVEPGNINSLAQALRKLMADRAERERLGTAAHASIQERGMNRQKMLEQYSNLYGF